MFLQNTGWIDPIAESEKEDDDDGEEEEGDSESDAESDGEAGVQVLFNQNCISFPPFFSHLLVLPCCCSACVTCR